MNFKEKKSEVLNWVDFYGQDIADTVNIHKAKCTHDLGEILRNHKHFLETQNIDALNHLDLFAKKLGIL